MAVTVRRATRRRPYGTIAVLALLALGLAWVLVPLSRGEPIGTPLAFLNDLLPGAVHASEGSGREASAPAPGKVRVFVSARRIPAYSKLVRDDLWDAARNRWAYTDVDESVVEESGVLVDAGDIVGRVLAHEKSPGYVFTEKDFLPKGTRPGISAGVPPGKRALRLEVDKVQGIVGLQPGDRFDMVAGQPLDAGARSQSYSFSGLYSEQMQQQAQLGNYRRARVQVLVQNGVVVSPLQTRQVPVTSSSLTRGRTTRAIPVQEMVIALDPNEVAPFMEALSVDANITCLARSGHPEDPLDSETPSSDPGLPFYGPFGGRADASALGGGSSGGSSGGSISVIESIQDGSRTLVPVPRSSVSPITETGGAGG